MFNAKKVCVAILFLFCLLIPGFAQDSHYWTNQYGTDAQLLGGLVVGSTNDLSATYYNPGAIALTEEERLVLSTQAVEFINIYVKARSGGQKDISSLQTRPAPGIFAFRFLKDSLQQNHYTVSVLTRRNFEHEFQDIKIGNVNLIDTLPGIGSFSSEFIGGNRLTETWIGFSYAHNFSDKTGIGITQYIAVRTQNVRLQSINQVIDDQGSGQIGLITTQSRYTHFRLLWKLGFVSKEGDLSYGITLTTPSIDLFGSGDYYMNISSFTTSSNPLLVSVFQEEASAFYRSPLSVSAGASYKFGDSALYFSLEYFNKVDQFTVMQVNHPDIQTEKLEIDYSLRHELDHVLNFGFGIEQKISDLVSLYGSIITDFSGVRENTDTQFALAQYDIYHISFGSVFTLFNLKLTAGIGVGFGSETQENQIDLSRSASGNYLLGLEGARDVRYRSIKLVFGFSSGF